MLNFVVWLSGAAAPAAEFRIQFANGAVEVIAASAASWNGVKTPANGLQVYVDGPKPSAPLLGSTQLQGPVLGFTPSLPWIAGQSYRAEYCPLSLGLRFTAPAPVANKPTVRLEPEGTPLPANALKFYLHFSEPMEQGVFMERLRLLGENGKEVIGPFRETELWSPDGKRLTVWFHPGRQKAGVNLNDDEGPVLTPAANYALEVSGTWRSAQGVAIGGDQRLSFSTTGADHECPEPGKWTVLPPEVGTTQPIAVSFNKGLDPAMLHSSLQVRKAGVADVLKGHVEIHPSAMKWSFRPVHGWQTGNYEILVDPALEDLAGNNLLKPFEVDLSQGTPTSKKAASPLRFSVLAR